MSNRIDFLELWFRKRQAPIHHQNDAKVTKHDVVWFDVAVHDATRVCKPDCITDLHQNIDVLVARFLLQNFGPWRADNAFHCVKQCVVATHRDIVNRDDVGVIQIARHNRFRKKLMSPVLFDFF